LGYNGLVRSRPEITRLARKDIRVPSRQTRLWGKEWRMAVTNVNTSSQTFRKLLGNGLIYRVPRFQRDYSWTEQEWDDLWQDITAMLEPGGEQGRAVRARPPSRPSIGGLPSGPRALRWCRQWSG
jgi:hypothetical protein